MLAVRVHKRHAESVRRYLATQKLMDNNYRIDRQDEFIYFPIKPAEVKTVSKRLERMEAELVRVQLTRSKPKQEAMEPSNGYDIIGEIALIDATSKAHARRLAQRILKTNKNVRTVLSKGGPIKGVYRTRSYVHVAGEKIYSTTYKENGAAFRLDVRKAFFSPRLAFERNRINDLVRRKENVVVMFAGVGPFAIEIGKRHKDAKVVAIELNKAAYGMMVENIELNKAKNVTPVLGDVGKIAARYKGSADRIVMPLPKDAYHFLDSALVMAKKGCIVHYYAFGERKNAFEHNLSMLKEFFGKRGKKIKVIFKRQVRTYSPREIEVVVDFSIL